MPTKDNMDALYFYPNSIKNATITGAGPTGFNYRVSSTPVLGTSPFISSIYRDEELVGEIKWNRTLFTTTKVKMSGKRSVPVDEFLKPKGAISGSVQQYQSIRVVSQG